MYLRLGQAEREGVAGFTVALANSPRKELEAEAAEGAKETAAEKAGTKTVEREVETVVRKLSCARSPSVCTSISARPKGRQSRGVL